MTAEYSGQIAKMRDPDCTHDNTPVGRG